MTALRTTLFALASTLSLLAHGQDVAKRIDIPAGNLVDGLDALARQSGAQFLYRADQLQGLSTPGVHGDMTPEAALSQLLKGSGYAAHRDASGALVIVKSSAAPAAAPAAKPAAKPAVSATPAAQNLEAVTVTGSRIARSQVEGPAPVITITAEDIKANGYVSVPDVLRGITQNGGETQSQQSASGADFSPGAQQVDLRGLGPNHTLVLVNGRRIADFPMPFKGRSNFTDISNIPLGMVQRIEVLTGSASAVYGSDAIAGVVNIILKEKADGTTVDYRYGDTTRGGGQSQRLSLSSGFNSGALTMLGGVELIDQKPLWAYQRGIQDSTQDAPTERSRIARRTFLRTDYDDTYLDPGAGTCANLGYLNQGSTYRASRPRYGAFDDELDDYGPGYYCGSDKAIGYGTVMSKNRGVNAYGSVTYRFDNGTQWFADVQLGYHKVELFRDVEQWAYMQPDGNETGYFYNQATDQVEYWQRQFTPEEMGGLKNGMITNIQRTFSIATGFKGQLAEHWDYEAAISHSQYHSAISWPQTIAGKANDLFLGPQLGVDDDSGLPIFNADPSRLYTPLTRSQYDSITANSTYHPKTRNDTLSFTVTDASLFTLPGGDAGFAAVAEYGSQSYAINPDPLATQYYYYSWRDSDGHGSRNRWALGSELRMPVLDQLNLSVAGRYDRYMFAGRDIGKFTWSGGVEWRPVDSLLVRGSYGTAFRAPDLHYVYAGEGNDETSGVDYYRCRSEEAGTPVSDCDYSDEGVIRTRKGNHDLKAETSTAWTAGVLWSPTERFDISADYFSIRMRNQVQDLSTDTLLQEEANCRLGQKVDGTPVDPNSPTCQAALARVTRLDSGKLYGVYVNPINIASENTSGVDVSAHYRIDTSIGTFRLSGNYTWVREHKFQQYPGDPTIDEFAVNSGFDIPRTKANASISWERKGWNVTLYGERLGRLPNSDSYDQVYDPDSGESPWVHATYRYNASVQYKFTDRLQLALLVDNLQNKMPPRDKSYTAYPYYDVSWFDSVGRSFYLQLTWKFGGSPL
ncbi:MULTISPECIES: TonB-dependent receptor [Dyella]|uniref:TonB-dependent receptor n=2 Tax=Dyella TaxID=231454 RepID=A0A4R0YMD8_9GAMM|nr:MULTISPECIES: TonB-dependent receptor [Dyella]TBR37269.1 TonB-dependent receptor [Dyella terrae]TCI07641.1 TonB-dependent receptor [Dyella soli]